MNGFIRTRTLSNGKKRHYAIMEVEGKQLSLGAFSTKTDAQARLRRAETEVAKGEFGREDPLFSEFYKGWFSSKRKSLKPGTAVSYESTFRLHVLPTFGEVRLSMITPMMVQEWVDTLSETDLSPATVARCYRYLRACLRQAESWDVISRCPCRSISLPKAEEDEFDILSTDEFNTVLEYAEEPERTLLAVLGWAGLRLGEGLGLKWRDVDFEHRAIKVQRAWNNYGWSTPKTKGSRRGVPMIPTLQDELGNLYETQGRPAPDTVIFSHDGKQPLDQSNARRDFNAALEAAEIRHVSLHSLRHFFASGMLDCGASVKYLQNCLGHASPMMTLGVYSHLIKDEPGGSVLRFDARMTGKVTSLEEHRKGKKSDR